MGKKNYETDKNNEKKNHEYVFYKKTIKLKQILQESLSDTHESDKEQLSIC